MNTNPLEGNPTSQERESSRLRMHDYVGHIRHIETLLRLDGFAQTRDFLNHNNLPTVQEYYTQMHDKPGTTATLLADIEIALRTQAHLVNQLENAIHTINHASTPEELNAGLSAAKRLFA